MALKETWIDGVLVHTEEVEDPILPEETLTIPKSSVEEFVAKMADPATNSIAELKEALSKLLEAKQE